jgi:hypothetical protein
MEYKVTFSRYRVMLERHNEEVLDGDQTLENHYPESFPVPSKDKTQQQKVIQMAAEKAGAFTERSRHSAINAGENHYQKLIVSRVE